MQKTNFYNGNPFLPKENLPKSYTDYEMEEIRKCMEDPIYFARNYIKITHVDKGIIPLDLYDFQEEFIQKCVEFRNVVSVQARQSGKTTTAAAYLLHALVFSNDKTMAILANKAATAREILRRIKGFFELLPDFLKPGVKEWNKTSISLDNGCILIAEASSSDNIRGKSISILFLDELAFITDWEEFSASVLPTLSSGTTTKLIIASTPYGLNHFYEIVEGARKGTNGYGLVEVPWDRVPGRDEEWKQKTLEQLNFDIPKFEQEYEIQFMGSSGTLISGAHLKLLEYKRPILTSENIKIYEDFKQGNQYVILVDTAEGKLLDYSAFSVIDISEIPYKQACTYRSNEINPYDYAAIIFEIAKRYNNPNILIELNNPAGTIVSEELFWNFEYENLLMTSSSVGRGGKRLSSGFGGQNIDRGIMINQSVKSSGCSLLKILIEQNKLIINDKETIEELYVFSRKGKSYQAEEGKHDDMVMGLVLFAWLINQEYFKELMEQNISKELREKSSQDIEDFISGLGIMVLNDGINEYTSLQY